jgi:hypothetical protein
LKIKEVTLEEREEAGDEELDEEEVMTRNFRCVLILLIRQTSKAFDFSWKISPWIWQKIQQRKCVSFAGNSGAIICCVTSFIR